jgi:RNA polymerase sigma factor (TIGR02999 family)
MRRILIEQARRKDRLKHGGGLQRVGLETVELAVEIPADNLLALDEALLRLAQQDAETAQLVKLHCFGGLTIEQAAEVLGQSARTAYRNWAFARAWLYREVRAFEIPPQG